MLTQLGGERESQNGADGTEHLVRCNGPGAAVIRAAECCDSALARMAPYAHTRLLRNRLCR